MSVSRNEESKSESKTIDWSFRNSRSEKEEKDFENLKKKHHGFSNDIELLMRVLISILTDELKLARSSQVNDIRAAHNKAGDTLAFIERRQAEITSIEKQINNLSTFHEKLQPLIDGFNKHSTVSRIQKLRLVLASLGKNPHKIYLSSEISSLRWSVSGSGKIINYAHGPVFRDENSDMVDLPYNTTVLLLKKYEERPQGFAEQRPADLIMPAGIYHICGSEKDSVSKIIIPIVIEGDPNFDRTLAKLGLGAYFFNYRRLQRHIPPDNDLATGVSTLLLKDITQEVSDRNESNKSFVPLIDLINQSDLHELIESIKRMFEVYEATKNVADFCASVKGIQKDLQDMSDVPAAASLSLALQEIFDLVGEAARYHSDISHPAFLDSCENQDCDGETTYSESLHGSGFFNQSERHHPAKLSESSDSDVVFHTAISVALSRFGKRD